MAQLVSATVDALTTPQVLLRAGIVGLGVSAAHGVTHFAFGDRQAFDPAGVLPAGIAVGVAGGLSVIGLRVWDDVRGGA